MRRVHIIAHFLNDYYKIISNRFNVISNYSKTIYIKIISEYFNVISDHFKTKMYIEPAQLR